MKKVLSLTIVLFLFIIGKVNSLALNGNLINLNFKHIKSVTTITEVFGDGQKVTAAGIEYDKNINNSTLSNSSFSVEGRTITKVYANSAMAKASHGINGKYVIIEL
jgi:predicted peptidase